jgi:hypothetical protein
MVSVDSMSWSHGLLVPTLPLCIVSRCLDSLLCLSALKVGSPQLSFCALQGATPTLVLKSGTS